MSTKKHIEVVPYNDQWPQMFESEAATFRQALGDNSVAVHHVGSTAVPGLAAKPTIDIIAVIKDRDLAIKGFESLGYEYRGEFNIPMRLFFNKKVGTDVNLHVYEEGNPEIELNLKFRDYLCAHPEARDAYAALKAELLTKPSSYMKTNPPFTGYSLGKYAFINNIVKQTGFNRLRMMTCTHYAEWDTAKAYRQKYFFDNAGISDPYTYTFDDVNHKHFVLYQGTQIIGYAHVQLWPEQRSAMRIIVIDEPFRNKGFGSQFLALCERWLQIQEYKSLHIESSPEALNFYKQHGYGSMPFNDPEHHESHALDTPVGKIL
jgi:GrpB-like predicted nucleotidyltransferase (UPF0157 family)/GNAT superfamily N-acetyltransferase